MDDEASGLATRLRLETQALHAEAERSGYVQEILKRRASRGGYALFLRNLLPAYQAMEQALARHARDPVLEHFVWPPLFRSESMGADLEALAGARWIQILPLLPEGQAYADRIEKIGTAKPARLIGHAYVRYIGDLSGGQIVQRILSAAPGLAPAMLGFYDFPGIADAGAYKEGFRRSLDQVGEGGGDVDDIVDEAKLAFRLNIGLSTAVLGSRQHLGERVARIDSAPL
ncbi:MAG: biliverdin-producing heme oxygenase [Rhizobiales bacterium]|nr:biliverdin-producing heme oxygenase [Hyphomicrobiales bacterium]